MIVSQWKPTRLGICSGCNENYTIGCWKKISLAVRRERFFQNWPEELIEPGLEQQFSKKKSQPPCLSFESLIQACGFGSCTCQEFGSIWSMAISRTDLLEAPYGIRWWFGTYLVAHSFLNFIIPRHPKISQVTNSFQGRRLKLLHQMVPSHPAPFLRCHHQGAPGTGTVGWSHTDDEPGLRRHQRCRWGWQVQKGMFFFMANQETSSKVVIEWEFIGLSWDRGGM